MGYLLVACVDTAAALFYTTTHSCSLLLVGLLYQRESLLIDGGIELYAL